MGDEISMNFIERLLNFGKNDKKTVTPGRNALCWCGSGKKYKRCHLETDEEKKRKKNL